VFSKYSIGRMSFILLLSIMTLILTHYNISMEVEKCSMLCSFVIKVMFIHILSYKQQCTCLVSTYKTQEEVVCNVLSLWDLLF
jgi:hypothetical protein